jgi:hypothetical protein
MAKRQAVLPFAHQRVERIYLHRFYCTFCPEEATNYSSDVQIMWEITYLSWYAHGFVTKLNAPKRHLNLKVQTHRKVGQEVSNYCLMIPAISNFKNPTIEKIPNRRRKTREKEKTLANCANT